MSNSQSAPDLIPAVDSIDRPLLRRSVAKLTEPVRFVGFWLSVLLPLIYLPLLIGGLSGSQVVTFGVLFAINAVALVVGHDYAR